MIIQQANASKKLQERDSDDDSDKSFEKRPWRAFYKKRTSKYRLIGAELKKHQSKRSKKLIEEIIAEVIQDDKSHEESKTVEWINIDFQNSI